MNAKLVAAFDASGKEDQSLLVVAGFISLHEDWQSFHTQWTERLAQDGLEHFHMVDFAACQKQFKIGWREDEPRRQRLYGDLLDIIRSHVYRQFASSIEMGSFDRLSPENKREYSLNAYALACRSCAADVRLWQKREMFEPPTGYVFEDGDIGRGRVTKRFEEDGFPAPVFLPKRDSVKPDGTKVRGYTPLQAADILAYELHKPHLDLLMGKPRIEDFRWGLKQLLQIPGEPGYYSPMNLEELNRRLAELTESSDMA